MKDSVVTTGRVKDARTVVLDERLPESLSHVRVVLEPLSGSDSRPYMDVMKEIRAGQHARGHKPRTVEEIDAYLEAERDSWD